MKNTQKAVYIILLSFLIVTCSKDNTPPQEVESSVKQILSFSFLKLENNDLTNDFHATVDQSNKTISVIVSNETNIGALQPSMSISEEATINPFGVQNFNSPVSYVVTAEDGSSVSYTVTVSVMEIETTLSGIIPSEGPKGTTIVISGTGFGEDSAAIEVYFNEVEAEVQSITDTEIVTKVPPRAYTGEVKVVINDLVLVGPVFSYILSEVQVTTLAGDGSIGFTDGTGLTAQFKQPAGVEVTTDGTVYVADALNNRIRKITPEGMVSTLAGGTNGFADGVGSDARFNVPTDLVVDQQGNIYVTDTENQRIRKITPDGTVTTYSGSTQGFNDGPAATSRYILPSGIALLNDDATLLITSSHKIRKINSDDVVSTFAGTAQGYVDAMGTAAQFNNPTGIAVDSEDNIYLADGNNNRIRKVTPEGLVSTFAGNDEGFTDGTGNLAQFNNPLGIAVSSDGTIYVSDTDNNSIRKITAEGVVTTLAGGTAGYNDGNGDTAQFQGPTGITVDDNGVIYVADQLNNRIRKIVQE